MRQASSSGKEGSSSESDVARSESRLKRVSNADASPRRRIRVLLIEDNPADEELLILELERGGYDASVFRVETESAMKAALENSAWDLIISDYSLPRFSGPLALGVVQELGLDIPFIVVSGTVGEDVAVAVMRAGASDYVIKGSLVRLCPAIERELREAALRAEQKKLREQLLISDRMASVGILAAGVGHEINNPLAALIANLELMSHELEELRRDSHFANASEAICEELRDAREGAERLRRIVRDLKIFSREPEQELRSAVDIQRILESSLRMARNEIRHRARVVREYGPIPEVDGNEARLGQVFLNLIVNAVHAMQDGGCERNQLTVRTRLVGTDLVATEFQDTGSGIAAENLPRIFDAFFTTKPIGVGTGLGLSICHRIVTGLGGTIEVESELNRGTLFRVLLPVAKEAHAAAEAPLATAVSACEPARRGRILVIDDEPMITRAVQRMLHAQHDVTMASGGAEALARIRAGERFDVILCDLMMPEMSGMELHATLSQAFPDEAAKMLFLTGGAFTDQARAFLAGVPNAKLEKPFAQQQLRSAVSQLIR